jgi:predicted GTPase
MHKCVRDEGAYFGTKIVELHKNSVFAVFSETKQVLKFNSRAMMIRTDLSGIDESVAADRKYFFRYLNKGNIIFIILQY